MLLVEEKQVLLPGKGSILDEIPNLFETKLSRIYEKQNTYSGNLSSQALCNIINELLFLRELSLAGILFSSLTTFMLEDNSIFT